jgi:hypothetical protein
MALCEGWRGTIATPAWAETILLLSWIALGIHDADTSGQVAHAGGLHDPVAAVLFCAPQQARHTVIHGQSVGGARQPRSSPGMKPVIATHDRCAAKLLEGRAATARLRRARSPGLESHHPVLTVLVLSFAV